MDIGSLAVPDNGDRLGLERLFHVLNAADWLRVAAEQCPGVQGVVCDAVQV
jgi:hypothetical protein